MAFWRKEPGAKEAKRLANLAVSYAKQMGYTFDYSAACVEQLETILNEYSEELMADQSEQITEKQIWSMSLIWGAYLGETIRRQTTSNVRWLQEEDTKEVYLINENQGKVYPVTKVQKRLREGLQDNVVSFYDVSLAFLEGKLDLHSQAER